MDTRNGESGATVAGTVPATGARAPDAANDPSATVPPADVSAWLAALADAADRSEEDLFSLVPVLGEPTAQAAVDGWVDQVVDLLRAIGEDAIEVTARIDIRRPAGGDPT